jgi:Ran GTPase-activating protein (RanGAP) involved in mRNA processing and transport
MADYQNHQLEQQIKQCQSSAEINLEKQNLTDRDMEIVTKSAIVDKQCINLFLSSNEITSEGVSIIASVLDNNKTLGVLWLPNNHVSDKGVYSLTRILSLDTSIIRSLSLANNGITNEGAQYIAEILKKNTSLTLLRLDNNDIGDKGMEALSNTLAQDNNILQELSISNNKLISDSSVDSLVHLLENNGSLRNLEMTGSSISETEKTRLKSIKDWNYHFNFNI